MATPTRFEEDHEVSLERFLLDAGRAERPGRAAKRRAAVALGIGGLGWLGLGWLAPSSTAAAALHAAKAGVVSSAKWIVLGAVGGGALVTAHYVSFSGRETAAPPAAVSAPAVEPARPGAAAAPSEPTPVAEPPSAEGVGPTSGAADTAVPEGQARTEGTSQRGANAPAASIADQIRRLDEVRGALASGRSAQALAQLQAFRKMYPRTPFGQEATVLRIEALVGAGQVGKARSAAQQFERSNPSSPHLKRLRALVGERDAR